MFDPDITQKEVQRFTACVKYARAVAKHIFDNYVPRDVQVIASTLYIQAMQLDTDDIKPLAECYLHAAQLASRVFSGSLPPVILSAAATLFIQHLQIQRSVEQPEQPVPARQKSRAAKPKAGTPKRRAPVAVVSGPEYTISEEHELTLVPEGG